MNKLQYNKLSGEPITRKTLDALPEYSISIPTKATIGKVWKWNINWFNNDENPLWVICEFIRNDNPELISIDYRRPILRRDS